MNDSITRISLDIHSTSSKDTVNAKRGDTARKIVISLVDGGIPYVISKDCYAVFTAKKPDGNVVYNDCTIENNTIIYKLTEQTVAVEGRVNSEIKLYGADDKLITSPKFTIAVFGTVYDEGDEIESSDEFNALTRLVSEAMEATENANKAATDARQTAKALMVAGEADGTVMRLDDTIKMPFVGFRIFGKTTQDGTPTPDAPVELVSVPKSGSIAVNVNGKNLLTYPYYHTTNTEYGVSFIVNSDGTVRISGTSTDAVNFWFTGYSFRLAKGVTYTLSIGNHLVATQNPSLWIKSKTKGNITYLNMSTQTSKTFTPSEDIDDAIVYIVAGSAGCSFSGYIEPQLEVGPQATAFEPYKSQRQIFNIAYGLHGIPVFSGGNYTDSNGQRWICNEIDFERGVYVQRIARKSRDEIYWNFNAQTKEGAAFTAAVNDSVYFDSNSDDTLRCLCNIFKGVPGTQRTELNTISVISNRRLYINLPYSTFGGAVDASNADNSSLFNTWWKSNDNVTILYQLDIPVETPLTEEELAAYAALHTYKDHTTVSNSGHAYMELEYVMDAKKYIDSLIGSAGGSSAGIHNATVE